MRSNVIIGILILAITLVVFLVLGAWLLGKAGVFKDASLTDAVLYIDSNGRVGINNTLQVEGPAPVPISAGEQTLVFYDVPASSPVTVTPASGDFLYVPPSYYGAEPSSSKTRGVLTVAAFPPDTTITVPDCTPNDSSYAVKCENTHILYASLSPGTYTVQYSNPHLGDYEETITIAADAHVRRDHSFITTVTDWEAWRSEYAGQLEKRYYYGRSGDGDALLIPFEATGSLLRGLF